MQIMDPLAEPGNHMVEIIDLAAERAKRRAKRAEAYGIEEYPPATVTRFEYDEEAQRRVETIFTQGDPGDEI